MSAVPPVVRNLIACEDILVEPDNPDNPQHITLIHLINTIRSLEEPPFPFQQRELCVFALLRECRGQNEVRLEIQQADTDRLIFQSRTRKVSSVNDPLGLNGLSFRIQGCRFPDAGLYWIRLVWNNEVIAQQPLLLR